MWNTDPHDLLDLHQSLHQLPKNTLNEHQDHHTDTGRHSHDQHPSGAYHPSRNRHTKRWMNSLAEVWQEVVRTSCWFDFGVENYAWQLHEVLQLKRKVERRCKYYDACIHYLEGLMPQTGSEVIVGKLRQLKLTSVDECKAICSTDPQRFAPLI